MAVLRVRVVEAGTRRALADAVVEVIANLTPLYQELTDAKGWAAINLVPGEQVILVRVMPSSGHWSAGASAVQSPMLVECAPITALAPPPWWHEIMNAASTNPARGAGMHIGVVDFDFAPHGRLSHVNRVQGNSVSQDGHGARVCRYLGEQQDLPAGVWGGIAAGAEMSFAAVNPAGRSNARTLSEAVEALLDEDEPPDLINMSLGFYRERMPDGFQQTHPDLEAVMEACWDEGVLPIAAVGNEGNFRPALPAAFDTVAAVAAIGLEGWGGAGSWARDITAEAVSGGRVAQMASGDRLYHPYFSCVGPEVNACGPGVCTLLLQENGVAFDYVGTSYAAPLVTGVLAVKLAGDSMYAGLSGRTRTQYAFDTLQKMCVAVGTLATQCGWGIPIL